MADEFRMGRITARQADTLNEILQTAKDFKKLSVAAPLALTRNAGIPVLSIRQNDEYLAEITEDDGGTPPVYTAKRKTRDTDNTVIDYVPELLYDRVLSTDTGVVFAAGDLVLLSPIVDYPGYFWAVPISPSANASFLARLTTHNSDVPGKWKFVRLKLDPTGAGTTYIDDGVETPDFCAVQAVNTPGLPYLPNYADPTVGWVRMTPSTSEPGAYEFQAIAPTAHQAEVWSDAMWLGAGEGMGLYGGCLRKLQLPGPGAYFIWGNATGAIYDASATGAVLSVTATGSGLPGESTSAILCAAPTGGDTVGTGSFQAAFIHTGPVDGSIYFNVLFTSFSGTIDAGAMAYVHLLSFGYIPLSGLRTDSLECDGGSGGSGGGTISVTALDSDTVTGVGSQTSTMASVTVSDTSTLYVAVSVNDGSDKPVTCTFGGAYLSEVAIAGSLVSTPTVRLFALYVSTSTTGDIVTTVTTSNPSTRLNVIAAEAVNVTGAGDQEADAYSYAGSSAPDSGATSTTTTADEIVWGVIGMEDSTSVTDGTWAGGFTSLTDVGPSTKRLRLAYQIAAATGTFQASLTGTTPDNWAAITYTSP